jgi:hypothetical protein
MTVYSLPVSGLVTKVGWGVTYGVQDRLFSFYMSPDECEGVDNCLIINSGHF